jgi:hypothetical protein
MWFSFLNSIGLVTSFFSWTNFAEEGNYQLFVSNSNGPNNKSLDFIQVADFGNFYKENGI